MNNRCSILRWLSSLVILMLFSLAPLGTAGAESAMQAEYETLNNNFMEKLKTINSRDAYKNLMAEHQKGLEALLGKFTAETLTDDLKLLKGKILFDLKKPDEALKLFEEVIQGQSPLVPQAKFEKVRVLLNEEKEESYAKALSLFRQVEDSVEKDNNYKWVLLEFAFSAKENKDREAYSYKFLKAVGKAKEFEQFKVMIYENLAKIEQEKGNIKKSIEILEKAMAEVTSERAKAELKSSLDQMKMVGNPAPEITAETWVNSTPLKLSDLKGKPVVIDFWATWCGPCRRVTPVLVKNYNLYKDKGLVVIGFTRLYGGYSDDLGNKGKVPPEEEKKLIEGYVQRHKITYPIAIADSKIIFEMYRISGIPTMVLIDKEGNVKSIDVGSGDEENLEKKIKGLLE